MGQRYVEQTLGRLLTDEEFRAAFAQDPVRAAVAAGFDLSLTEIAALRSLPLRAFARFGKRLDARICRLRCPGPTNGKENQS